ncbi:MAG: HlyD family efflux transporter periplasmic adaptor subunit [Dehalococcoidia bacterium]
MIASIPGARPRSRRTSRGVVILAGLLILLAAVAATFYFLSQQSAAPVVTPVATPAKTTIDVRGQVVPARSARIAPLVGGTVIEVFVHEGDTVQGRDEIMRVSFGGETTVLVAPYAGQIAALQFKLGDTILAGQTAATVADFSRFRIETTDLDEFSVGRVREGAPVSIVIDGLGRDPLPGTVSRIALAARTGASGDVTYPTTIDFDSAGLPLRWGMTARIKIDP